MSEHQIPATIALAFLFALVVVRIPSVFRERSSRLTWLASLVGVFALASVGVAIPLSVLDGWLGGSNFINLAQNILATTAFWLVMQAGRTLDGSVMYRREWWQLPIMIVAFTVPFLLIPDRSLTTAHFIDEHASKPELWAYASIYMLCVVFIMARWFVSIRGRRPRQYILMRVGVISVAIASLIEVLYLTLRVFVGENGWIDVLGDAFIIPFYGGVLVAVSGIAGFTLFRGVRVGSLRVLRVLLERANISHGLPMAALSGDGSSYDTYRLAVRLTDIANSQELTRYERILLRLSSYVLDRQMRAPEVVSLSRSPRPELTVIA